MSPRTKPSSVVLAAGGTAGHLEPALAVARALVDRDPSVVVTFLGTRKGLESTLVPARGYDLRLVEAAPMPRGVSVDWIPLLPRLLKATRQARRVLADVKADVVVGFGGYAALPAYLAARRSAVSIVVHEANARAGVANRVGARLTPDVAVSTPDTGLPHATLVGIPLREEITTLDVAAVRVDARRHFGLEAERPTLLVFGGSQGASRLNQASFGAAPELLAAGVQVLHAVGPGNSVMVQTVDGQAPYVAVPYLERMDLAYAAADLALCRSGAMTCAELAAVGLPSVLVPYPFSNQEQVLNAQPLVARGSALLVDDGDLTPSWVIEHVVPLVADPDRLSAMRGRASEPAEVAPVSRLLEIIDHAVRAR